MSADRRHAREIIYVHLVSLMVWFDIFILIPRALRWHRIAMSSLTIVSVILPLLVISVMFGLGLTLSRRDFLAIKNSPRPVFAGLFIQMLVGPAFALLICHAFQLPPMLAIGMMLLSATPGGAMSSIYTLLAKGDVALNITITAINALLGAFIIPLIVHFAFEHFVGSAMSIPSPLADVMQKIGIILVPLLIGVAVGDKYPEHAKKADPWIRRVSITFLIIVAIMGIRNEWETLKNSGVAIAASVLAFNFGNYVIAYWASRLMKLNRRQAIAISFEVGFHNSVLAIAIAVSPNMLNSLEIAIPAVFYGCLSLVSAGLLVRVFLRHAPENTSGAAQLTR